jgi:hypothetical protein
MVKYIKKSMTTTVNKIQREYMTATWSCVDGISNIETQSH